MVKRQHTRQTCDEAPRRAGRPRSESSRAAILEATVRFLELEGNGLEKLAIEQLAAQAGVGKATVYRWWSTRTALVVEAFVQATAQQMQYADTGSLIKDISIQMRRLARLMSTPRGRMLGKILAAGQCDDDLRQAFCENYIAPRRKQTEIALRRGIARGELAEGIDLEAIIDSLFGPMYFRLVLWKTPPSEAWAEALCRRVLCGAQITDVPRKPGANDRLRALKNTGGPTAKR